MTLHETTVLVFGVAIGLEALGALLRYREWIDEVVGRSTNMEHTGAEGARVPVERDRYRVESYLRESRKWWLVVRILPTGYSPLARGLARLTVAVMLLVRFAYGEPLLPNLVG